MFIGLAVVVAGLAGFFVWEWYGGYSEYRALKEMEGRYIEAMTEDTFGGETPQETLNLFVAALKTKDVELASKYFMLDDNLSREKWVKTLAALKEKEVLDDMARDMEGAEFYKSVDDIRQLFIVYNDNKTDSILINFIFNKYSKVWKIESL